DTVKCLRVIQACLDSTQDDPQEETEDTAASLSEISDYVGRIILPVLPASKDDDSDDDLDSAAPGQFSFKGELGLNILHSLTNRHTFTLNPPNLLSVVAYTDPRDEWTSKASAAMASNILQSQFSGSLSFHSLEDRTAKSWKYTHVYAVTIFEWAVTNAATSTTTTKQAQASSATPGDTTEVPLLAKTWHLFTPVLLTLLDESETALKVRALGNFGAFWSGCPPGLMDQVGLASVFEDAVFPAVHFLPNITPEDESRRILDAAYPALFQLAGLRKAAAADSDAAAAHKGSEATITVLTTSQRKLLDRIIREGILTGYFHAKDHIHLTCVFCEQLSHAVNGMGILSVKYLKDIFPMISEVMANPFGTKHPQSLLAAIHLLQAVLRCCWPRIPGYQNEIIRILTVCWLNIADEDTWPTSDDKAPTKKELEAQVTKAAAMLSSIIRNNNSQEDQQANNILLDDLVSPLIKKEPLLAPLFTNPHHDDIAPLK
ncbi:hypothetical protein PG994_013396, partial [Apiospora phragmitis]